MRTLFGVVFVSVAIAVPVLPLAAQTPDAASGAHLSGKITDFGRGAAIAGAHVAISPRKGTGPGTTTSDESGRFTFPFVRTGTYSIDIRRSGYRTIQDSIVMVPYHEYRLSVTMIPDTMERRAVVEVTPWRISSHIGEFYRRRQSDRWGTFFSRQDIERIRPGLITDLLRRVPGIRVHPMAQGLYADVTMQGGCAPQFYVDNLLMTGMIGTDVDRQFTPNNTEAVEVYRGDTAPGGLAHNPCGTIVIWSRTFDPGTSGSSALYRRLVVAGIVVGTGLLLAAGLLF